MENFKKWLEGEFNLAVGTLKELPLEKRKGYEIGLLRKRARDMEITRNHLAEFESLSKPIASYIVTSRE